MIRSEKNPTGDRLGTLRVACPCILRIWSLFSRIEEGWVRSAVMRRTMLCLCRPTYCRSLFFHQSRDPNAGRCPLSSVRSLMKAFPRFFSHVKQLYPQGLRWSLYVRYRHALVDCCSYTTAAQQSVRFSRRNMTMSIPNNLGTPLPRLRAPSVPLDLYERSRKLSIEIYAIGAERRLHRDLALKEKIAHPGQHLLQKRR
jgi:hypothetical protein